MMSNILFGFVAFSCVYATQSHIHTHDGGSSDVPSYAQCHAINESFSPVCPQNLGPPCPYCYSNWMTDYINSDTTDVTVSNSMKLELYNLIVNYANEIVNYWPPSKIENPTTDYAVFNGIGGLSQIFLRLYQHVTDVPNQNNQTATQTLKEMYLNYASEYLDYALDLLPSFDKQEYVSYFNGNVGVWFLAAVYNQYTNDIDTRDTYLKLINETFEYVYESINGTDGTSSSKLGSVDLTDCTIDTGIAGLLYTGMLINAWFENNNVTRSEYTWIDVSYLKALAYYIIEIGQETGKSNGNNYLQFEYPTGCYFIGQGHGSGGAVRMMLELSHKWAPELLEDTTGFVAPITNTLDYYVSVQYDDGNVACMNCTTWGFPTQPDIKVQWCHGAPGFIGTFSKAALVFDSLNTTKSAIYLNAAYKASNATWQRGLLLKGLTYCHGIGGNTYMFLAFYNNLRKLEESRLERLNLRNKNNYNSNDNDYDFVMLSNEDKMVRMIDVKHNNVEINENLYFLANQSAWRAKQFVSWVMNPVNVEMVHVATPVSGMFQGNHGIIMLLSQLLEDNWPAKVQHCMPGWNSCV